MTMVVIVCGGRSGHRQVDVSRALDAWHAKRPIGVLIHGDCLDPDPDTCVAGAPAATVVTLEAGGRFPDGLSADACADRWATSVGAVPHRMEALAHVHNMVVTEPVDVTHRRMAQELRRYQQAGRDVAVLAFPGGKGTEGMVTIAKGLSLPVWRAEGGRWVRDRG